MLFQSISVAYGKRLRQTLDNRMPTIAYIPKQVAYASLLKVITSCTNPFISKKLSSVVQWISMHVLNACSSFWRQCLLEVLVEPNQGRHWLSIGQITINDNGWRLLQCAWWEAAGMLSLDLQFFCQGLG